MIFTTILFALLNSSLAYRDGRSWLLIVNLITALFIIYLHTISVDRRCCRLNHRLAVFKGWLVSLVVLQVELDFIWLIVSKRRRKNDTVIIVEATSALRRDILFKLDNVDHGVATCERSPTHRACPLVRVLL